MPKSKKFIDRKTAVTFHLVHRSQQDPLAADETAPQHVLLEARDKRSKEDKKDRSRTDALQKFGIYYDDDYDYLQHLRDANTLTVGWEPVERFRIPRTVPTKLPGSQESKPKLNLPSSVFASEMEEDVGLLNKAAPQTGLRLDLDPDIVAAMDDDFDFADPDRELEDNFIELANAEADSDYEDCSSDGAMASDEEEDEVGSLGERQFADEETKSRFTEYSMTSSVMRRTEQLSILDGRFEHMFAGYDDSEIGALDCDEIEGHVAPDDAMVLQCAEEFKKQRAVEHLSFETPRLRILRDLSATSDEDEDDDFKDLDIPDRDEKTWDCQSIISTYSNIYNRPRLISEPKGPGKIRVNRRTGIPLGVIDDRDGKLTATALARHDAANSSSDDSDEDNLTVLSKLSTLSIRPPGETPEQRLARKKALKDYRKERRLERKANTLAFKEEKKRQEKVLLNNARNQQSVHIV